MNSRKLLIYGLIGLNVVLFLHFLTYDPNPTIISQDDIDEILNNRLGDYMIAKNLFDNHKQELLALDSNTKRKIITEGTPTRLASFFKYDGFYEMLTVNSRHILFLRDDMLVFDLKTSRMNFKNDEILVNHYVIYAPGGKKQLEEYFQEKVYQELIEYALIDKDQSLSDDSGWYYVLIHGKWCC